TLAPLREFPLRHCAENVRDQFAVRSVHVQTEIDSNKRPAALTGLVHELGKPGQAARQTIQLRSDDPARLTVPATHQSLLELRTVELRARLVEVGPPSGDLVAVGARVGLDRVALDSRGDERFPFASCYTRHPDVAVQRHDGQFKPSTRRLWPERCTCR